MKIDYRNPGYIPHPDTVVDTVLQSRGVNREWLKAGPQHYFDGSAMKNFEAGRDMLLKHESSKIGILMDQDADGIFSTAIMYMWLKDRGIGRELVPIVPEGKVHGIILDLIPQDIDLLIIPDASSSEWEKHKALGVDILILDHHLLAEKESEYAVTINPMLPDCPYLNKGLSGAGVVYKFIEAMDKIDGVSYYSKYIDLTAFSIVSDVMDTSIMENKALVNEGTSNITNPFLLELINSDFRIKDKTNITPITIGFYLVPPVNALIRIGSVEDKYDIFKALVGEGPVAETIAKLKSLKSKQDRQKDPAVTRIVLNLQRSGRDQFPVILAEAPNTIPRSVTGLVAGQLAGMYSKPTMLGRPQGSNFVGSLRSLQNSSVEDFRGFCEESGLVNWARGHASAAGFSLPLSNVEPFLEYAKANLPPFERKYLVDFKLDGAKDEIVRSLELLQNHYGPGFEEVLLYDEIIVNPEDIRILGQKNNVINIDKGGFEYIQFNFKGEMPTTTSKMKIVGKPSVNRWMDKITPQLIIEAYEHSPVELL